jgi:CRP-like cAMP-binding protein
VTSDELEQLRGLALFSALEDSALVLLCAPLSIRTVPAHTIVFADGDPSHTMYVLLEGEIELVKGSGCASVCVARLSSGEWFGEVGLLGVSRRGATARSSTTTRLLELPARELRALYKRDVRTYALLTMNLARGLARKLQRAEAQLAEALRTPAPKKAGRAGQGEA